jgi:hypothetical protein
LSKAIIIKRISRRTGHKGVPRQTIQSGIVRLQDGDDLRNAARKVLTQVKRQTDRDSNDRQIESAEVITLRNGRHRITEKVLFRVYKSESDHLVHVYPGEAHRGTRDS